MQQHDTTRVSRRQNVGTISNKLWTCLSKDHFLALLGLLLETGKARIPQINLNLYFVPKIIVLKLKCSAN
jgi:hypothetical protein